MNCSEHHEKEASFRCSECGAIICKECAVEKDGKMICNRCLENDPSSSSSNQVNRYDGIKQRNYGKRYNTFLALIFSLIPGVGQMYLGFMKRGLQLMVLFAIPIVLANLFYVDASLAIFNVIIWFYGIFDCLHIRRTINEGEDIKDEFIYDFKMLDLNKLNNKHLGIGLIAGGGLVILNNGLSEIGRFINKYLPYGNEFYMLLRLVRQSIFPILLMVIGVYLLKKSKIEKE